VSAFERHAIQRLVDRAQALGVDVPAEVEQLCGKAAGSGGAVLWVAGGLPLLGAGVRRRAAATAAAGWARGTRCATRTVR
jgi:hypothetical protein